MSFVNRRRKRVSPEQFVADTLEPRLLLSGVNGCCDDELSIGSFADAAVVQSVEATESGSETGLIERGNRNDWFDVTVTEQSNISIGLTELTGNLTLRLYEGNRRIERSTRGGTNDETINAELEPGEYRIRLTGHRRATGSYQLDWDLEPVDGAGNTRSTARDLGTIGSASFEDRVSPDDRFDVYRFTVDQRSQLDLSLTGLSADADLQLVDSEGAQLASSLLYGSEDEQISGQFEAGTYYAVVTPWQEADTEYSLTVDAMTIVETPIDDGDTDAFPDVPDLRGSRNWHLNSVNAPEAWAQGYTGEGVLVAVLDTGVRLDHGDLQSNIYVNPGEIPGNGRDDDGNGFVDDINGWDFTTNTNDPNDVDGHGTHVAGIIAAASDGSGATGVAHDATILPVQVLGDDGFGSNRGVADGIRYAVDAGADIINLSLGGGFSSIIRSAIRYAEQNDVLVVAAAGNESAATPGFPAVFSSEFDNTLSVGAFSSSNDLAGFSNRVGNSGAVQLDAPGVSVYSTYGGGHARLSGTSMATPNVAGVAALALSANPDLSAADLRTLLVNGATESIADSDSVGRVNAATTVAFAAAGITGSGATAASRAAVGVQSSTSRTMNVDVVEAGNQQNAAATEDLFGEVPVRRILSAIESESDSERLVVEDGTKPGDLLISLTRRDVVEQPNYLASSIDAIDVLFADLDVAIAG